MRRKQQILALAAATTLTVLVACGDKQLPPTAYAVGDDSLPSISEVVSLGEDFQWSVNEDDNGVRTYLYEGLSSGTEVVQDYAENLQETHQCTLLTEDTTARADSSALSAESGTVVAAKESDTADGLFQLSITWDDTTCSITPSFSEGAQLPQEEYTSMTLDEAVNYLRSFSPETLGLSEADMSAYNIFSEDGVVLLNGQPCLCLNVYRLADHQYEASYLLSGPDYQVYRLDRETGQASPIDT